MTTLTAETAELGKWLDLGEAGYTEEARRHPPENVAKTVGALSTDGRPQLPVQDWLGVVQTVTLTKLSPTRLTAVPALPAHLDLVVRISANDAERVTAQLAAVDGVVDVWRAGERDVTPSAVVGPDASILGAATPVPGRAARARLEAVREPVAAEAVAAAQPLDARPAARTQPPAAVVAAASPAASATTRPKLELKETITFTPATPAAVAPRQTEAVQNAAISPPMPAARAGDGPKHGKPKGR